MEATGRKIDQVHVFKQTFRPNEPFRAALSELVIAGSGDSRPFSIYGSDERVIDMSDTATGEFNVQQREANKFMAGKHNVHLAIEAGIKGRLLKAPNTGAAVLQLVMEPVNKTELLKVREGLDVVRVGRRRQALGFEALQLYMNIPFSRLIPLQAVKEKLTEINDELNEDQARSLYRVTPLPYLVGSIMQRPLPPTET